MRSVRLRPQPGGAAPGPLPDDGLFTPYPRRVQRSLEDEASRLRAELGLAHQHVAHLEEALRTSRRIGIALGIVMERYKVTADGAFDVLRRLSQERNEKLRDVAEGIMSTGKMPDPQGPPRPRTSGSQESSRSPS